jgi:DNA-binding NarL/FixJ family response regulator
VNVTQIPPHARIDVVEDEQLTRSLITERLQAALGPGAGVRGFANVEELVAAGDPGDVVLLDLRLKGGGLEGSEAIEFLARRGLRILVLSSLDSAEALERAHAAGARGYVTKDAPTIDNVLSAIAEVTAGRDYVDPLLRDRVGASARKRLTPRQQEVLRLEALGRTFGQIARGLDPPLSEAGVRRHIEHIVAIYPEYASKPERVRLAIRLGLASPWEVYRRPKRRGGR